MRSLVAVVLLAVGLSACSSATPSPAITVNGRELSESDLLDQLEVVQDNRSYRDLLEQQLGLVSAGSGQDTVGTDFVATLLSARTYFTLVRQELDRRQVDITEDARSAVRQQLESEGGEEFASVPEEQREGFVNDVSALQVFGQEVLPAYAEEVESQCAAHILVGVEERPVAEASARADDLAQQLADGASFETLATEQSDDPSAAQQEGSLGCTIRGSFDPDFEEAAYALEPGEISDPVQTQFGFHIIRVTERPAPLEQVSAALQDRLLTELTRDAEVDVDPRYGSWSLPEEAAGGGGAYRVVAPEGPSGPRESVPAPTSVPTAP